MNAAVNNNYNNIPLGGQNDPLGTVQEIKIWRYEQMKYAQPWISSREWDTKFSGIGGGVLVV